MQTHGTPITPCLWTTAPYQSLGATTEPTHALRIIRPEQTSCEALQGGSALEDLLPAVYMLACQQQHDLGSATCACDVRRFVEEYAHAPEASEESRTSGICEHRARAMTSHGRDCHQLSDS